MLLTRPARVSTYDFRRPNKLNREHVRALEIVGETFGRQLTTVLGTSLRCAVSTTMDDISQFTYDEYVRELPSPTLLTVLDMPPLKGAAMMHLPAALTMGIVERLLGGSGGGDAPHRAPTDIEMRLLTTLLDRVLARLGTSFDALIHVDPRLNRTETNPQFAQVAAPTDMVVVTSFTVRIEGAPCTVTLALPFTMLAPVLEDVSNRTRAENDGAATILRDAMESSVQSAPLEVLVRFDEVILASKAIAALAPGDVISLDQPLDKPLTIEVAGLPRFLATAGTKGKHVACLVTDTTGEVPS